MFGKFS